MIKLVILDFTGVIVTGGHKKLSKILGEKYNISAETVYSVVYTKYFEQFAQDKISEPEAYEGPIRELGFNETWQELAEMYLETHVLDIPMVEYMAELRKKYKLVILTKNIPRYLDWENKKFHLDGKVDAIINTFDLKLPKAGEKTVRYILDRFGVMPEEAVYIDDQKDNLEPAKEIGVKTIFYQNFEQAKTDCEKIIDNV